MSGKTQNSFTSRPALNVENGGKDAVERETLMLMTHKGTGKDDPSSVVAYRVDPKGTMSKEEDAVRIAQRIDENAKAGKETIAFAATGSTADKFINELNEKGAKTHDMTVNGTEMGAVRAQYDMSQNGKVQLAAIDKKELTDNQVAKGLTEAVASRKYAELATATGASQAGVNNAAKFIRDGVENRDLYSYDKATHSVEVKGIHPETAAKDAISRDLDKQAAAKDAKAAEKASPEKAEKTEPAKEEAGKSEKPAIGKTVESQQEILLEKDGDHVRVSYSYGDKEYGSLDKRMEAIGEKKPVAATGYAYGKAATGGVLEGEKAEAMWKQAVELNEKAGNSVYSPKDNPSQFVSIKADVEITEAHKAQRDGENFKKGETMPEYHSVKMGTAEAGPQQDAHTTARTMSVIEGKRALMENLEPDGSNREEALAAAREVASKYDKAAERSTMTNRQANRDVSRFNVQPSAPETPDNGAEKNGPEF